MLYYRFCGPDSSPNRALRGWLALLFGPGHVPPSEKTTIAYIAYIAYIGCGTQGVRQLIRLLPRDDARVVAVCDPNTDSNDYVEWGTIVSTRYSGY